MTLNHYRIFFTVIKQKSFLSAAELLGLTPSAVSHAISKLEKELGIKLFIRQKQGIITTDAAETLLPYVRTLLNDADQLHQVAQKIKGLEIGCVKIGMFNSICVNWMPQIIKAFREKYPKIEVQIFQGGYDDVARWIQNDTVDIGFVSMSNEYHFDVTPLYKDALLCIVPKGFKCLKAGVITPDDLKGQHLIHQSEGNDIETRSYLKKHHLSVATPFQIEDDQSLLAIVESGLGICIVSELILKSFVHHVDSYPLKPEAYRVIGLAVKDKEMLSPVAEICHDFIVSFLRNSGIANL
jgi:DNA-binding transcriptional LysR family regulator